MLRWLTVLALFCGLQGPAQLDTLSVKFDPILSFNSESTSKDSIVQFKCYLSNFALLHEGSVVWTESSSYHLIDMHDSLSQAMALVIPSELEFDALQYHIGIDSTTSVSGVFGGDLDPTNGMYWTWNSGYIHFKLEGHRHIVESGPVEYQYHLGGYAGNNAIYEPILHSISRPGHYRIAIDLPRFISEIGGEESSHIMSPGPGAVAMAKRATQIFGLQHE